MKAFRLTTDGAAIASASPVFAIAATLHLPEGSLDVLRAYRAGPATYTELLKRLDIDMMQDIKGAGRVIGAAAVLLDQRLIEVSP